MLFSHYHNQNVIELNKIDKCYLFKMINVIEGLLLNIYSTIIE